MVWVGILLLGVGAFGLGALAMYALVFGTTLWYGDALDPEYEAPDLD